MVANVPPKKTIVYPLLALTVAPVMLPEPDANVNAVELNEAAVIVLPPVPPELTSTVTQK